MGTPSLKKEGDSSLLMITLELQFGDDALLVDEIDDGGYCKESAPAVTVGQLHLN